MFWLDAAESAPIEFAVGVRGIEVWAPAIGDRPIVDVVEISLCDRIERRFSWILARSLAALCRCKKNYISCSGTDAIGEQG
jgi:hypothetical protein